MPALAPYIPGTDSGFDTWLGNFSTLITAAPLTYGLTAGDAATIAGYQAAWAAAYAVILSPSTKTPQAVSDKNTAKASILPSIRVYAQQVANNPGVASGDKIALGLNPRTSLPAPITPPTSNPVLLVQSASSLSIILRYRDSAASVKVKAKPYGVIACALSMKVSATPIVDPTLLDLQPPLTKSPATLTFSSGDAGKQVYFAARWQTRTGGYSPWSSIISFTVPQGT